ncbi:GntP family permease [Halococcus sp. IIIV-5B]|uniref:GntP family permease n=1 Tax=Halococcus sp. IIIV-5B TaxID=2321230 RepID=UPI000E71E45F|nr:SLC13 family permease [Halococcus sp. IIIV-5B]RJT07883.1 GntP family permease [Halococcus sp. IIIV-5B]
MSQAPLVESLVLQSATASPSILAVNIVVAVAIILVMVIRFDINAAVSLVVGSLYMGIASGLGLVGTTDAIGTGFGDLMGAIGIPLIFGIMIGTFLAECGGARRIATTLVRVVPTAYVPYAVGISGVIVAIPVFFDVAFIVLAPMVIAVWRETDLTYPTVIGSLAIGAGVAHTFIPPTPNPLAAPNIIGFPLGEMLGVGLVVGLVSTVFAVAVYRRIIGLVWDDANDIREIPFEEIEDSPEMPSFGASLLPIATPLVLILLVTVTTALAGEPNVYIQFLGSRIIALLAGLAAAVAVYISVEGRDKLAERFSESLEPAGLVLAITGAGGAFGYVIQETGSADALVSVIGIGTGGFGILLLAYVIGLVLRAAQGSGTVAGITAMTIVAGIQTSVPGVALAMAALSGGLAFGHINDSGFWIATEVSGLETSGGLKTYTLGQTVVSMFGLVGAVAVAFIF